jgi:type IV pilus assembly protein PilA
VRNPRLQQLRGARTDDKGFTLIELLVVILIIGILAAIAIPTFLNQKGKADDASAKALAHTAEVAMESYSTDHDGSYVGVASPADLQAIEPSINTTASSSDTYLSAATGSAGGFTVVAVAGASGDQFTVTKTATNSTHTCSGSGGGCTGGSW